MQASTLSNFLFVFLTVCKNSIWYLIVLSVFLEDKLEMQINASKT